MDFVEAVLTGKKEEFRENESLYSEEDEVNPECYIHMATTGDIPDYLEEHEDRRQEARTQNLEYDVKYGAEVLFEEEL